MSPLYWQKACEHLSLADPALKKIIQSYRGEVLKLYGTPFYTLVRAIVGQQLSIKAADTVFFRLQALVSQPMQAQNLIKLDHDTLRSAGLSNSKARYIHSLSEWWHAHDMDSADWDAWDDKQVVEKLTSIKGIGQWTAEMFLIFALHRPNILPVGDLGLQKAVARHYGVVERHNVKDHFAELRYRWRPWCSVATWYLWRSLDMDV